MKSQCHHHENRKPHNTGNHGAMAASKLAWRRPHNLRGVSIIQYEKSSKLIVRRGKTFEVI